MRLRTSSAALFLLVLFTLVGREATASERLVKGGDPCLRNKECKALYEQARKLSKIGQMEAALVQYQSAFAAQPVPWMLVNIGRTQQKLGRPQQAIVSYKRFLDTDTGSDPQLREKTATYIAEAEKSISEQQNQPRNSAEAKPELAANTSLGAPTAQNGASPGPSLLPQSTGSAPDGAKLTAASPPMDAPRPIYKKWWFWTTIAVVGAAAAGGIAAGVVLSRPTAPIEVPVYQPTFR